MQDKIEYSYPLLDKRIVEFIMNLPAECFVEKGVNRSLFRTAIDGLLPDTIIFNAPKKEPVRVKQLISRALKASKRICNESRVKQSRSSYINVNKLMEKTLTTELGNSSNDIRRCGNIRAALAIILSGY
jgi:asparagine synthase (glutamine-hydrolysing)